MYRFLKRNIKSILSKEFLFKNELFFRYFFGVFYLGKKHKCNICSNNLRSYISFENKDLLCPFCGSLSRNRRLWSILNTKNKLKGKILHLSPSRSLYRKFKQINDIDYYSSDFEDEFLADYKFDITNIKQESEKFDIIICYHILEHIIEDEKAISELYRVLKKNGVIYLQTPFKNGDIYENDTVVSAEERKIHFGQEDHVRIYSVKGLKKRLENVGFNVFVKAFDACKEDLYFGFKSPEIVLIITK